VASTEEVEASIAVVSIEVEEVEGSTEEGSTEEGSTEEESTEAVAATIREAEEAKILRSSATETKTEILLTRTPSPSRRKPRRTVSKLWRAVNPLLNAAAGAEGSLKQGRRKGGRKSGSGDSCKSRRND